MASVSWTSLAGPLIETLTPARPVPSAPTTDTARLPSSLVKVPGAGVTVLVTTIGLSGMFFAETVEVIFR